MWISEWQTMERECGRGVGSDSPFDGGLSERLFRAWCLCRGCGSCSRNGAAATGDLSQKEFNHGWTRMNTDFNRRKQRERRKFNAKAQRSKGAKKVDSRWLTPKAFGVDG